MCNQPNILLPGTEYISQKAEFGSVPTKTTLFETGIPMQDVTIE